MLLERWGLDGGAMDRVDWRRVGRTLREEGDVDIFTVNFKVWLIIGGICNAPSDTVIEDMQSNCIIASSRPCESGPCVHFFVPK